MKRLHGMVFTPPDTRPAPCYPSRPIAECWHCSRHCSGELPSRDLVRIDASAVLPDGAACQMQRPITVATSRARGAMVPA